MNSMKYLTQFLKFHWNDFAEAKQFRVTAIRPWKNYETKEQIGWIVDVAIVVDNTEYKFRDGEIGSNLYAALSFKTTAKPSVNLGDLVEPVNPVCTVYGDYKNQLSVKCDDVRVVSATKSKD